MGSFYDAFVGGGGPSYFWTGSCGTHSGLCVIDTRPGSNEYAGIQVGDQILEMGGVATIPASHVGFRQALTPPFDGNIVVQRGEANAEVTIPIPQYDFMAQIAIKNLVLGLSIAIIFVILQKYFGFIRITPSLAYPVEFRFFNVFSDFNHSCTGIWFAFK